jgi:hypothetical protein
VEIVRASSAEYGDDTGCVSLAVPEVCAGEFACRDTEIDAINNSRTADFEVIRSPKILPGLFFQILPGIAMEVSKKSQIVCA